MENTISLNVLVIPPALQGAPTGAESAKVITEHNIIVLEISPNRSVYQLKPMIKELNVAFVNSLI